MICLFFVDHMMNVNYRTSRDFWIDVEGRSYYVFKVKACQDAHIKLCKRARQIKSDTYEVRIGTESNQKTVIIPDPNDSHQVSADTPNVLDCNQYTSFWISWKYDTLYVGRGAYAWEDELLRYQDSTPHTINAALMEFSSGQEGVFSVNKLDGKNLRLIEIDMLQKFDSS